MSVSLYEFLFVLLGLVIFFSFKRHRVILFESIQNSLRRTDIEIDNPTNGATKEKRYKAKSWVDGQKVTHIY